MPELLSQFRYFLFFGRVKALPYGGKITGAEVSAPVCCYTACFCSALSRYLSSTGIFISLPSRAKTAMTSMTTIFTKDSTEDRKSMKRTKPLL